MILNDGRIVTGVVFPKSFQHQVMQVPEITVVLGGEVPDEVWDARHWEETPR